MIKIIVNDVEMSLQEAEELYKELKLLFDKPNTFPSGVRNPSEIYGPPPTPIFRQTEPNFYQMKAPIYPSSDTTKSDPWGVYKVETCGHDDE